MRGHTFVYFRLTGFSHGWRILYCDLQACSGKSFLLLLFLFLLFLLLLLFLPLFLLLLFLLLLLLFCSLPPVLVLFLFLFVATPDHKQCGKIFTKRVGKNPEKNGRPFFKCN